MRSQRLVRFPLSCITENSGGSKKRPLVRPLAEMKFPHLSFPVERLKPRLAVPKEPYDAVASPCGCFPPNPDRVVTTITRLVLSPNSGGGAPWITSSDCTASSGSWLENILLCWSVIGWPSTEKEFSA